MLLQAVLALAPAEVGGRSSITFARHSDSRRGSRRRCQFFSFLFLFQVLVIFRWEVAAGSRCRGVWWDAWLGLCLMVILKRRRLRLWKGRCQGTWLWCCVIRVQSVAFLKGFWLLMTRCRLGCLPLFTWIWRTTSSATFLISLLLRSLWLLKWRVVFDRPRMLKLFFPYRYNFALRNKLSLSHCPLTLNLRTWLEISVSWESCRALRVGRGGWTRWRFVHSSLFILYTVTDFLPNVLTVNGGFLHFLDPLQRLLPLWGTILVLIRLRRLQCSPVNVDRHRFGGALRMCQSSSWWGRRCIFSFFFWSFLFAHVVWWRCFCHFILVFWIIWWFWRQRCRCEFLINVKGRRIDQKFKHVTHLGGSLSSSLRNALLVSVSVLNRSMF